MKLSWLLGAALAVALVGCDDDHGDEHGGDEHGGGAAEAGPDADACEHMIGGPAQDVTAGADEDNAVVVSFEHTRVDIALVPLEGQMGGYLRYEAAEEGEFAFFFDQDVPVTLVGGDFEASGPADACSEVVIGHTADLSVGPTLLKVGPTDAETLRLVTVHVADHDH